MELYWETTQNQKTQLSRKCNLEKPWIGLLELRRYATTECRATFNHSPNEPARLARQWMKERGPVNKLYASRVGFIYLTARLARQWDEITRNKLYGVKCWVHVFWLPSHHYYSYAPPHYFRLSINHCMQQYANCTSIHVPVCDKKCSHVGFTKSH